MMVTAVVLSSLEGAVVDGARNFASSDLVLECKVLAKESFRSQMPGHADKNSNRSM